MSNGVTRDDIKYRYNDIENKMIKKLESKGIDIKQVRGTTHKKVDNRNKYYAQMKYNKPSAQITSVEEYFIKLHAMLFSIGKQK